MIDTAEIRPDTPIRLAEAALYAFPNGGMTAAGLRKERDRGHLKTYRVAGKEFTTPLDIERMLDLCRTHPRALASISARPTADETPSGSSAMESGSKALDALLMSVDKLSNGSRTTSRRSTGRSDRTNVIPLKSP